MACVPDDGGEILAGSWAARRCDASPPDRIHMHSRILIRDYSFSRSLPKQVVLFVAFPITLVAERAGLDHFAHAIGDCPSRRRIAWLAGFDAPGEISTRRGRPFRRQCRRGRGPWGGSHRARRRRRTRAPIQDLIHFLRDGLAFPL